MTAKIILQAILAFAIFLPACGGPGRVSAKHALAQAPQRLTSLAVDRTDVPWHASRTEDPDNIRAF